jgi:hypothetical protein
MMGLAPAEISAPDPLQMVRKRLCDEMEMEAIRGVLRKAELAVSKNVDKGRAAPGSARQGQPFPIKSMEMETDHTPCGKRRKLMPPVGAFLFRRSSKI